MSDSALPLGPLRDALQQELIAGERLVWSGRPALGLRLRPTDAFIIPFSILWAGFAFFWEGSVLTKGAPAPFALFGVPFVLMGLYIVVGRFFVDARIRASTAYGLSDRRAIIISGIFSRRVQSVDLQRISEITFAEHRDGRGTITFGAAHPWTGWASGGSWPGTSRNVTPQFELIADARAVYAKARALHVEGGGSPQR